MERMRELRRSGISSLVQKVIGRMPCGMLTANCISQSTIGFTAQNYGLQDGTEAGTHLAFDFGGDAIGSDPAEIISIGDNLYVIATTAQNGREVFVAREENLTPTGLALSSSSIAENLPVDTSIGSFSTNDPNAADSHTYSLVSGSEPNDNDRFTIDGDVLKTTRILNFEVQRSYSILVEPLILAENSRNRLSRSM